MAAMIAAIGSPAPVIARPGAHGDGQSSGPREEGATNISNPPSSGPEKGLNGPVSVRAIKPASDTGDTKPPDPNELTEEQEREVEDLRKRETEVRAHEAAHTAAAGPYARGRSFEYTTGPDGKRYISGGEVKIDAAPVRDNPEATIRKMEVVLRAALAPADPSSQDRQVARQAQQNRAKAQTELARQRGAEGDGKGEGAAPALATATRPATPDASAVLLAGAAYGDGLERSTRTAADAADVFETIARLSFSA